MSDNAPASPGLNGFMGRVLEWITGKDARLQQLETEAKDFAEERAQAKKLRDLLAEATEQVAKLSKQVDSLTAENQELAKRAVISEEAIEKRINTLVAQRLSTIGVQPVKEKLDASPLSQGGLIEQFNAETDPDKRHQLYGRIKREIWQLN